MSRASRMSLWILRDLSDVRSMETLLTILGGISLKKKNFEEGKCGEEGKKAS